MMTQKEIMITMNQMNPRIKAHTHEAVPTSLLTRFARFFTELLGTRQDTPCNLPQHAAARLYL